MNRLILQGTINTIKYLPNSCIVIVDDYRKGYIKSDGERVEEKRFSWKVLFKPYFKNYIAKFFNSGMVVEIDAEMFPYAIENDKIVEGYSCIGKTIDLASYPRRSMKQEVQMMKDSQLNTLETPDIAGYKDPDF